MGRSGGQRSSLKRCMDMRIAHHPHPPLLLKLTGGTAHLTGSEAQPLSKAQHTMSASKGVSCSALWKLKLHAQPSEFLFHVQHPWRTHPSRRDVNSTGKPLSRRNVTVLPESLQQDQMSLKRAREQCEHIVQQSEPTVANIDAPPQGGLPLCGCEQARVTIQQCLGVCTVHGTHGMTASRHAPHICPCFCCGARLCSSA